VLLVEQGGGLSQRLAGAFEAGLTLARTVTHPGALAAVREGPVDLVLMEAVEPSSAALRAVERIMAERPVPIMLLVAGANPQATFPLLAAGALDALVVPARVDAAFLSHLRKQALLLATVRVVQHPRGRRRRSSSRLAALRPGYPLVAIAASLGGPRALEELLDALPEEFAAPIVVCQHMTPGFTEGFAHWLQAETGRRVQEARDGQHLVKGEVFIAPSSVHLVVQPGGVLRLDDGAAVGGFRPSCDVLLRSAAAAFGRRTIGVVLTGMGRDGARGLLEVRGRGGHTIAQDEASCAVFGMPREAIALGAAEAVLPLSEIAAQLARWVA
jgi:two-component system chemotaxis response regulator CheB